MLNWQQTLIHVPNDEFIQPYPPQPDQTWKISLRVHRRHDIHRLFLTAAPDGEEIFWELKPKGQGPFYQTWTVKFNSRWHRLAYRFCILTQAHRMLYFNNHGLSGHIPPYSEDFVILTDFKQPHWLENAVFYQIFPDRFYRGNPETGYRDGEYRYDGKPVRVRKWGANPLKYSHGRSVDFFNGDLDGIRLKLDYLCELGVNALYLNPIFRSPSNHRYDVIDFEQVDPHLGGNKALERLMSAVHEKGMHLILDIMINHTGIGHRWFGKPPALVEFAGPAGAFQDANSPFADYYTFYQHPEQYECWNGISTLPKLNYRSEKLRRVMFGDPEAILKKWLKPPYNLDGWRFDTANVVARQGAFQDYQPVWRDIRQELKSVKPDAYLMGEHFFDATDLLQGDTLDSMMNYRAFYQPILFWLAGKWMIFPDGCAYHPDIAMDAVGFANQVRRYYSAIPWQVAVGLYNLVSSHDIPRFYTLVGTDLERMKTAMLFQFTFVGVPALYYGEEIGMQGWGDPDCRRCMPWDRKNWDLELRDVYRGLIELRKNKQVLRQGGVKWLSVGERHVCYARHYQDQCMVVMLVKEPSVDEVTIALWKVGILQGSLHGWLRGNQAAVQDGEARLMLRSECYWVTG